LAIHNLLENALKFSRPGDTLELRAFEDGADIVIEVADTGPGIPEQEQPHVWEELYRGEAGRGIPGSGLGLALVRAIAERHNGRVSLRSRLGQGTVFSLRLPVILAGRQALSQIGNSLYRNCDLPAITSQHRTTKMRDKSNHSGDL
jgi:two-component system OmpR family sensor kinase